MINSWQSEMAVILVAYAITAFFLAKGAQTVTWPPRRPTAATTAMVFVMVAVASVFLLLADQVMRIAVTYLLGIGS